MQIKLKKPSELKSEKSILIKSIHVGTNGNGIACYCPDCGVEIEFNAEWPIDIPITCGAIQDDNDICKCRFIIPNSVTIED